MHFEANLSAREWLYSPSAHQGMQAPSCDNSGMTEGHTEKMRTWSVALSGVVCAVHGDPIR